MNTLILTNDETGEEVEVEFTLLGGYARATLYSPAECPEVEFTDELPSWADESECARMALEQAEEMSREDEAEARFAYESERWDR